MSRFEDKMSELGYELDTRESESGKLVYKKRTQFSTLVLVFHLEEKNINPILIADTLIIGKRDLIGIASDFASMREDAKLIASMSGGKFRILN